MANEPQEIRQISWTEVFGFTQIFKSRKLATHPSKLLLGLLLIMFVALGGIAMDKIWSVGGGYANTGGKTNEIVASSELPAEMFDEQMEAWLDGREAASAELYRKWQKQTGMLREFETRVGGEVGKAFATKCRAFEAAQEATPDDAATDDKVDWSTHLSDADEMCSTTLDQAREWLDDCYAEAQEAVKQAAVEDQEEKLDEVREQYRAGLQFAAEMRMAFDDEVAAIRGQGIASSLWEYEKDCTRNALRSVLNGNFFGGLKRLGRNPGPEGVGLDAAKYDDQPGFVYYVAMGFNGVRWLFTEHLLYAAIFSLYLLIVVSLFGGAIYRIAALHAAREEKVSMTQALKFSGEKFLSFMMAPLVPLIVIAAVGGMMALGGLLGNIMGGGAVALGAIFFLSLIGGLVVTFLLFGLVGGAGLMYPTIAVEGSDSFDAISRSYSYIFNRPWRALWYAGVALVHGTVCYVFVRLFAFVVLKVTHVAVGVGVFAGGEQVPGASDRLDAMWTAPTYSLFHAPINSASMSTFENIGAILMAVWVYLVIGLVMAFLISYFISASTMIYFLLRRHVDATDLDDVFVEETEEEPMQLVDEAPAEAAAEETA
jgi:hypothetical protein